MAGCDADLLRRDEFHCEDWEQEVKQNGCKGEKESCHGLELHRLTVPGSRRACFIDKIIAILIPKNIKLNN